MMVALRLTWMVYAGLIVGRLAGLPLSWWVVLSPLVVLLALSLGQSSGRGRGKRGLRAGPPPAVEVAVPVAGRWSVLNSPADKVPSHGTHGYGQTYAIDIIAEPAPGARPAFAWLWPVARRNEDFPAFGQPLYAVADATVVHADDHRRDHLSRNSLAGVAYLLLLESAVREMGGAGLIVGNHVVLDLGDGTYAMYAHLQRGSLQVRAGDRVRAGQLLARCGNSGNSSEPHLHFQLMDHPDLDVASGIPFSWRGIGVPANGEVFRAGDASLSPP
ncbi:M23 family peptidase [Streptomyces paludis]|uniref:M23 family peptidase n=2 Tax=Streptomyces paludis TaxID=2282738 RepID=A0A345I144_9ACTN|nr:M23 family peptidase [Streptomyces paludis]